MLEIALSMIYVFGGIAGLTIILYGGSKGLNNTFSLSIFNVRILNRSAFKPGILPDSLLLGSLFSLSGGLVGAGFFYSEAVTMPNILLGVWKGALVGVLYAGFVRGVFNIKSDYLLLMGGFLVGAGIGALIGDVFEGNLHGITGGRFGGIGGAFLGVLPGIVNPERLKGFDEDRIFRGYIGAILGGLFGGLLGGLFGADDIGIWGTWGTTRPPDRSLEHAGAFWGMLIGGLLGMVLSLVAQFLAFLSGTFVDYALSSFKRRRW